MLSLTYYTINDVTLLLETVLCPSFQNREMQSVYWSVCGAGLCPILPVLPLV